MKKTLLTAVLSALAVIPAFAETETMTDERAQKMLEQACKQHPKTEFWVENDKQCVALDVCQHPEDAVFYKAYCNKDSFARIDALYDFHAENAVKVYVKKRHLDCAPAASGNYVICKGKDFMAFKFKSIGEGDGYIANHGAYPYDAANCFALGGVVGAGMFKVGDVVYGDKAGCILINDSECKEVFGTKNYDLKQHDLSYYTNDSWPNTKDISTSIRTQEIKEAKKICPFDQL